MRVCPHWVGPAWKRREWIPMPVDWWDDLMEMFWFSAETDRAAGRMRRSVWLACKEVT